MMLMALDPEFEAEAEEAKLMVEAAVAEEQNNEREAKQIGLSDPSQVKTSRMHEYIDQELSDLSPDLVVYNILECPKGKLQGDARSIS